MTKVTNVLPTGDMTLNSLVSEAFVQFFVEVVGHYSLHMSVTEKGERVFQREPFRKSHGSRNVRHFLHFFMETQMFAGFIQDRELSKNVVKGSFGITLLSLFETRFQSMVPRASAVGILSHGTAPCPSNYSKEFHL